MVLATHVLPALANKLNASQRLLSMGDMWLKGSTVQEIATAFKVNQSDVVLDLTSLREVLAEQQLDTFKSLAAERVEALRGIVREAWIDVKVNGFSVKTLDLIRKCEGDIGKLLGVNTDKVLHLHKGEFEHKLYDFTDNTPATVEVTQGNGAGPRELNPPLDETGGTVTGTLGSLLPSTPAIMLSGNFLELTEDFGGLEVYEFKST